MPAIATTSSLNNYPRLSISSYREQLRQGKAYSIELGYSYGGKSYSYSIKLDNTACHYGNYRHWWLCPKCSKRVSVLYCAGLYVCRHCIGANYGSQLKQPIDRLFSRAEAIRRRLGWQAGIAHGNQGRPKHMHFSTYYRLINEHNKLVQKICGATMVAINKNKGRASYER
ncbi:hypothetical protein FHS24_002170 [Psychrobacter luti]|uniref:Uncharacterized protein n=1 Tax=Psychrobacter luti TaxID=198481 RepID=A0A839TER2_9GAMM|nr:hypothetical protein [Psychrobacter luti]MBB3107639.1 hypothetical protein [Psychrobacter luti]